jgi:hypothetical protein
LSVNSPQTSSLLGKLTGLRIQSLLSTEARADIFDYIECFYNPRRRRKLEALNKEEIELNSTVRGIGVKPDLKMPPIMR